jgi:hypothetical protein
MKDGKMNNKKLIHGCIWSAIIIMVVAACNLSPVPTVSSSPTSQPTSYPTPSPSPTPLFITSSVEIMGEEEMVYDMSKDHCPDGGVPDLPIRAFRNSEGLVQFNLSGPTNFRMIGETLDSVQVDCTPTLTSNFDPDPAHFSFSEWMGATYTLDGETVYALIHNEYHGDQGSTWYAFRDFSANQGEKDWYYQSWNGSTYRDMVFDARSDRWKGPEYWCEIGSGWASPNRGCDATRTWVSPVTTTVTISGSVSDSDPGGGNGVIVTVLKGDEELWSKIIDNADPREYSYNIEVPVEVGDRIHFRVNSRGDGSYDSTGLSPEINIGPDPCSPGMYCHYMDVTSAISHDGGNTFTQAPAPTHLVASLPYKYQPNNGLVAQWQPSNIVKNPKDDYYYALVQIDIRRTGEVGFQGMCVMRTMTLDDPQSWRAWNGESFNMRFINPYLEMVVDPNDHTCKAVSVNEVGALSYNLTYNTYLDKFLAVGHAVNVPVPGFYYSISDDLVHWAPMKILMATDLAQTSVGPFLAYPSLVDPDNASLNFDVTGQSPYLYFSRFKNFSLEDVDLLRVRIQFNK